MVITVGHGGGCCGAHHLYGFNDAEERDPEAIVRIFNTGVPHTRMTEVILNGRQVEAYPRILAKLAEMGFVLDRHWINGNHNSDNYAFSRCDYRKTLELPQWPGMIASVGLHGRMPRLGLAGAEIPLQRHIGGEGREERVVMRDVRTEVIQEVPAPIPAPTVVATFYVNRYRTSGRSLHYFLSYEQAVNARRDVRGAETDMLEVMSDGVHRWTENFIPR